MPNTGPFQLSKTSFLGGGDFGIASCCLSVRCCCAEREEEKKKRVERPQNVFADLFSGILPFVCILV